MKLAQDFYFAMTSIYSKRRTAYFCKKINLHKNIGMCDMSEYKETVLLQYFRDTTEKNP